MIAFCRQCTVVISRIYAFYPYHYHLVIIVAGCRQAANHSCRSCLFPSQGSPLGVCPSLLRYGCKEMIVGQR